MNNKLNMTKELSENEISSNYSSDVIDNIKTDDHPENNMNKSCGCGSKVDSSEMKNPSPSFVYAIGKVVSRFPNRSIELELAQATGRRSIEDTKGITHEELIYRTLTDPNSRYIARQICYVLTIEGLETYILVPADPLDIDRIAQALKPVPGDTRDIDVIIGRRGPIAPPEMCNGLMIPIVIVDQIYSFDRDDLIKSIPKRKGENEEQIKNTSNTLFNHIVQIADNAGATDEHRAINYLSVRYDEIYHRTQTMQDENYSFTAIEVRLSRLSSSRKIVDVVFTYENRTNRAIQQWFTRIDVTEEFPFLISTMQQYLDR